MIYSSPYYAGKRLVIMVKDSLNFLVRMALVQILRILGSYIATVFSRDAGI
jgi:hypothetical protein